MTMKLGVQEEPAIYKVLLEPAGGVPRALSDLVVSDVAQTSPGGTGEFDYIDIGSINNLTKQIEAPKRLPCSEAPSRARQRVRAGDVLVSMTRPNLNAVALVPNALDGATASTGFHVLRAGASVEPAWLFYAVQSPQFVSAMTDLVQGALYPAVRPKDIRAFSLVVPPNAGQREVVAYLDEQLSRLDASVAALHRVQGNLKRYRASVLKSACEGRLVPTEAELARQEGRPFETGAQLLHRILAERRHAGAMPVASKDVQGTEDTDLPDSPVGWKWASAGQLLSDVEAGRSFRCDERPPRADEVGVLKVSAVSWGEFNEDESKTCVDNEKIDSRYMVKTGDFLFSRANTIDLVGACVVVNSVQRTLMLSDKTLRLEVTDAVLPKWLLYCLRSKLGRKDIERLSTGNQESMRNIGQARIRRIRIPLPPLAEQHRIVAEADRRLSLVRVAEAQLTTNLARAQRLRQSILQAAFRMPAQAGQ